MKRLSIISGVLFLCTSLMAANKITGKIIDESNNQHIEYANVSLLTQDSTFITGVATDNGGGFLLKEVNDGIISYVSHASDMKTPISPSAICKPT